MSWSIKVYFILYYWSQVDKMEMITSLASVFINGICFTALFLDQNTQLCVLAFFHQFL